MAIFNRSRQFDTATPIIPRHRDFEKPRASNRRRDITTQVRHWLHSKDLIESWVKPGAKTVWHYNGRPMLTLTPTQDGFCQITLEEWVVIEIGSCGLMDSLSSNLVVKSSRDLKLVKPFLRLALDQPEWAWLRDVDLIMDRMADHRMTKLEAIFVDGIVLNEEAVFAYKAAA